MRLAKFLAVNGVASRRASERIVADGRVTVDGQTVTDPATAVDATNVIAVDGERVDGNVTELVVYAVNKPAGVVSTAADTHGRPTITSLVKTPQRLYPVGRLDADTTGLILLTNDGALAYRLTHPSFEVDKTYRAVVARPPVRSDAIDRLRKGVLLDDGKTAPARVARVRPDTLEITIHEGRKRQVKRMCATVGHRVLQLERIRFGPLRLGDLRPGQSRELSAAEIALLRNAGSSGPGAGRGAGPGRGAPLSTVEQAGSGRRSG